MARKVSAEICGVGECGRPVKCKGLCSAHYLRLWKHGETGVGKPIRKESESLLEYFEARINKTEGCWLWVGPIHKGPMHYGMVAAATNGPRLQLAHRVSWNLYRGKIPPGMSVLHDCPSGDNPLCVNPDHLWLGTHQDNSDDMVAKGRSKHGEKHHEAKLTDEIVGAARARRTNGESIKSLAAEYGVCYDVMREAIRGETWKHVGPQSAAVD